jgi:hypothetical protein
VNCQVTVVVAQCVGSGLKDIGVGVVDLSCLPRLREAQKYLLDEILGIGTVVGSFAKEAQQWSVVATRKRIDRVRLQLIRRRLGFKVAQHGTPMTRATMGHGNRVVKVTETSRKISPIGVRVSPARSSYSKRSAGFCPNLPPAVRTRGSKAERGPLAPGHRFSRPVRPAIRLSESRLADPHLPQVHPSRRGAAPYGLCGVTRLFGGEAHLGTAARLFGLGRFRIGCATCKSPLGDKPSRVQVDHDQDTPPSAFERYFA